jgi:ABC-type uncharacterized transport system substrate-binding protein
LDRRRATVAIGCLGIIAPALVIAQPVRPLRIALLDDVAEPTQRDPWRVFLKRLAELGYREGKNLSIEVRTARGVHGKLPVLATEAVAQKPDVIITTSTPTTLAAMHATSTIPIVFTGGADPVGTHTVAGLAHPGGNVTGVAVSTASFSVKWIQLLREMVPGAKRIAYLGDPSNQGTQIVFAQLQDEARKLQLMLKMFDAREQSQLERSLDAIARERFDAMIVGANTNVLDRRERIVQFEVQRKLPTIHARREYVDAGGLVFYGADYRTIYSRAAEYVERIARGAQPSDMPVERPSAVSLVVNLKTARASNIKIPQSILVRADEVIE